VSASHSFGEREHSLLGAVRLFSAEPLDMWGRKISPTNPPSPFVTRDCGVTKFGANAFRENKNSPLYVAAHQILIAFYA